MDKGVIETAFRIPDYLKIHGLRQKYKLRKACRGLVPENILKRKKSLQRLRHDRELSDVLESLAVKLLSPPDVEARGLFAPEEVDRLRRRHAGHNYPKEQAYGLWSLILTEMWARLYIDNRGRYPTM
jgi:asparagine synthase (glutamine-hydrolysing)